MKPRRTVWLTLLLVGVGIALVFLLTNQTITLPGVGLISLGWFAATLLVLLIYALIFVIWRILA